MVQRLTYRRRHCYATRSNKVQKVKTPGRLDESVQKRLIVLHAFCKQCLHVDILRKAKYGLCASSLGWAEWLAQLHVAHDSIATRYFAGGRLIFQYKAKRASPPKCGATGVRLQGVRTTVSGYERALFMMNTMGGNSWTGRFIMLQITCIMLKVSLSTTEVSTALTGAQRCIRLLRISPQACPS